MEASPPSPISSPAPAGEVPATWLGRVWADGPGSIDRWSILAGLRFILASIVAIGHLQGEMALGILSPIPYFGSFEAILGFLVISGYSVTSSYLKEPRGFFLRRLKRIYPIYLAAIVLTVLVKTMVLKEAVPSPMVLLPNLAFLNQIFTDASYVGPAWSLSLEIWLYCCGPALLALSSRWSRSFAGLSLVLYIAYTVAESLFHLPYFSGIPFGANLLLLAFPWICGMRLAVEQGKIVSSRWDLAVVFWVHLIAIAGIQFLARVKHHSVASFFSEDLLTYAARGATLWLIYTFVIRSAVVSSKPQRSSKTLRLLGDISYPLYLVHLPVYTFLTKTFSFNASTCYATAVAVSTILYLAVDSYSKRRHLRV